jgi:hypothetical protein
MTGLFLGLRKKRPFDAPETLLRKKAWQIQSLRVAMRGEPAVKNIPVLCVKKQLVQKPRVLRFG